MSLVAVEVDMTPVAHCRQAIGPVAVGITSHFVVLERGEVYGLIWCACNYQPSLDGQ